MRGVSGAKSRKESANSASNCFVLLILILAVAVPIANAGGRGTHRTALLSPFDSLIWDRKRTLRMFGYRHALEAYVPKDKRLFGYFALPVLVGDDIVAAIDLKADRKARKLLMQKWSWVAGAPKGSRKELKRRIEQELDRFERFQLAD